MIAAHISNGTRHPATGPFFDHEDRLALLAKLGDPLPGLERVIDCKAFRPVLSGLRNASEPSQADRPLLDPVPMFKVSVLQQLYNLSDDQSDRVSDSRPLSGRRPSAGTASASGRRVNTATPDADQ